MNFIQHTSSLIVAAPVAVHTSAVAFLGERVNALTLMFLTLLALCFPPVCERITANKQTGAVMANAIFGGVLLIIALNVYILTTEPNATLLSLTLAGLTNLIVSLAYINSSHYRDQ